MKKLILVLATVASIATSCEKTVEKKTEQTPDYLEAACKAAKIGDFKEANRLVNKVNRMSADSIKIDSIKNTISLNLAELERREALAKVKKDSVKKQKLLLENEKRVQRINEINRKREIQKKALKQMRSEYDDIKEITWYYAKTTPKYVNVRSDCGAYFCTTNNQSAQNLRLSFQYVAEDWLFIKSYIIKVDGKRYDINEQKYNEIETDNSRGKVYEWLDRTARTKEIEILKAISTGKNVKIRYVGRKYHEDRTVTNREKLALRNVLDAYEYLGGSI